MSRIRSIKPEWLDDERMAMASDAARVLSIALVLLADDYGRGRAGRMQLLGRVFPGRPAEHLEQAFVDLAPWFVTLYEVDGQTYFEVRNWDKHQRVDKPGLPKVPGPNLASARHDDGKPPPVTSQEFPAKPQELPANPSASRASLSPSSGSDLRSGPPSQASPDQPEKSGSARARRKPSAKSEHAPFLMHDDWCPPEELLVALGSTYIVPPARIAQTTQEFRYYWKKRGERKKQAGWERAYSSNVERQAKSGALYVGVLMPTSAPGQPGGSAEERRRLAAAVEARARGGAP